MIYPIRKNKLSWEELELKYPSLDCFTIESIYEHKCKLCDESYEENEKWNLICIECLMDYFFAPDDEFTIMNDEGVIVG